VHAAAGREFAQVKTTSGFFRLWPALLVLAAALAYGLPATAAERGWFGIGVNIDAEGEAASRVVRSVTIQTVAAESPAARAGLSPGDVILEADDAPLPGMKMSDLRQAMGKAVGETLHLKVRREGAVRVVALTAVAPPPGA
jgi:C-terminal processing protease CtpA/Prc